MPNNSCIIFLAGHGIAIGNEESRYVLDGNILGEFHITFPSGYGRRLCYTAHNLLAQPIMLNECAHDLYHELQKLEFTYGVSSVDINNIGTRDRSVCFNADSQKLYLSLREHREYLKNFIEEIDSIMPSCDLLDSDDENEDHAEVVPIVWTEKVVS